MQKNIGSYGDFNILIFICNYIFNQFLKIPHWNLEQYERSLKKNFCLILQKKLLPGLYSIFSSISQSVALLAKFFCETGWLSILKKCLTEAQQCSLRRDTPRLNEMLEIIGNYSRLFFHKNVSYCRFGVEDKGSNQIKFPT